MAGNKRKHSRSVVIRKTMPTELQECGHVGTPHGSLLYLKIRRRDYQPMSWSEVWQRFSESYPDRWAVMFLPPASRIIDEANIYHLYVMPEGYHPGDADICLL